MIDNCTGMVDKNCCTVAFRRFSNIPIKRHNPVVTVSTHKGWQKCIVLFFILLMLSTDMYGQTERSITLSLEDVIETARNVTLQAKQAKQMYESDRYSFESFLASRRWQLGMSVSPSYQNLHLSPGAFQVSGFTSSNFLSAGAMLDFSKLIGKTGGYVYASSDFAWSTFFGENADTYRQYYGTARMFGTTPIRVGYRHELLGYNGPAWEKKIMERQIRTAEQEYAAAIADVSEKAAQYFFLYASEKAMYDMYRVNAESSDSLYKIGLEKYSITSIRKDELLSLQLQLMNSQNDVRSSYNSMEQAKRSLLSFLEMEQDSVSLDILLPENPDHPINVSTQQALDMAKEHNPAFGRVQEAELAAEREVDRTRHEKGLQMNLDLSVGIQKYGYDMSSLGSTNKPYTTGNVTMAFPIVDHGMRQNNYNAAKSRLEYYSIQTMETERTITEAVANTVGQLLIQQQMLADTKEAMELADESFTQNQYNYAQGLSDINTFTLAQNRKDSAHINYINTLSNFWLAYYRLCSLTLYDFYNMRPL